MKGITRLTTLLAFLCFAAASAFAAPRAVIVEEFTNASCNPCAAQNPTFQKYLFDHYSEVIPIVYHASFPGGDVMFNFDKPMVVARQSYYTVAGVPTARVNGIMQPLSAGAETYAGAPLDTVAISAAAKTYLAQQSPIVIGVTAETDANYKMSIHVNVASTEAIANKKVRLVLAEAYHYYQVSEGTNGEEDFYFIARKMFPDVNGTTLNLEAEGSQTYDYTYDIPENLYHKNLYVVAFVQDDETKEILQAARSSAPSVVNEDKAPKVQVTYTTTEPYKTIQKGQQETYQYTVKNDNSQDLTVAAYVKESMLSQGWTATVTPDTAMIPAGSSKTFSVSITSPANASSSNVSVQFDPLGRSEKYLASSLGGVFYLTSDVKYLNVYGGSQYSAQGINTVLNLPDFANEATWIPMDFAALQAYPAKNFNVVYIPTDINFIANVFPNGAAATAFLNWIKAGMDNGTHFLLTSDIAVYSANVPQYANAEAQSFFNDYIGVTPGGVFQTFNGTNYSIVDVNGNPNDELTKNITFKINGDYSQQWPVLESFMEYLTISNTNTTSPIFTTPTDNNGDVVTGVKVERTLSGDKAERAIYLGFNPETIGNATTSKALYTALLNWLANGPKSVIDVKGGSLELTVGPNPAVDNANVRLVLNGVASLQGEVYVIDLTGRRVAELHNGAIAQGANEFQLNSARLSSGSYFAIVNIDGKTLSTPFNVVK